MLTKFWGRPIYLGAAVLLPRDYDRETMSYPVNYIQGHFSLAAPYGFDEKNDFSQAWLSDSFPRMIAVTLAAPDAVLRRLVRGELGEQRPVRRRDHAGARAGGREALPRDP